MTCRLTMLGALCLSAMTCLPVQAAKLPHTWGSPQLPDTPQIDPAVIEPVTEAERRSSFYPLYRKPVRDSVLHGYFLADKFEYQDADDGTALSWDVEGWIGGDIDRLRLRSEGERLNGFTESAEIQALWGHALTPWWDSVVGIRHDFKPRRSMSWLAFGVQGTPLYNLELEATAYLGEASQSSLRLEADYDILLTNRLILQPTVEANFYGKHDPQRGRGTGLSDTEAGLRLRYLVTRQFAPYVGVSWSKTYGDTLDLAREEGEDDEEARVVAGVRFWF